MVTRWSEQETMLLIELYKSYEFLWNRKNELYKNIFARKQAYDEIVKEMRVPNLTSQDVRSKIKNLRTSYYQELRKIASAKANNKILRPLRWFLAFKAVMGHTGYDVRDAPSKQTESYSESEDDDYEEPRSSTLDDSMFIEESACSADAYVVSIKQEFLDEMENLGDKVAPTICDYLEPVHPVPKKRPPITLNTLAHRREREREEREREAPNKSSKRIDEFQIFANNIAQQLRKMPLSKALNLQLEVQAMIAKERIILFKKEEDRKLEEDDSN